MQELHINSINQVTSYGISCPIVIKAEDNNTYVLKTRNDGILLDKVDYAIFMETLSYKLFNKFGIENIPEIIYLIIDDDFIEDAEFKYASSKDEREQVALANIKASKGLNLGVKWIENTEKYIGKDFTKKFIKETINNDGYIMNSDRNENNPNILYCRDDKQKYLIDFGGAFETLDVFYSIEDDNVLFELPNYYSKFCYDNDYLLLNEINTVSTTQNQISKDEIIELIEELPDEWKPHKVKDEIAYIISQRVGNKEIFKR